MKPLGIMIVLPVRDPHIATRPCWTDPNVKGVCIRDIWSNTQPTQTSYDFSYFQTGLELAAQNNKWVTIQINGGSGCAPAWLYTQLGPNVYVTLSNGNTPAPWNVHVQTKWSGMVQAWAQGITPYLPVVAGITLWCGGTSIECFFAQTQGDVTILDNNGGVAAWLTGAEALAGAFSVFSGIPLSVATGNVCLGDGNATMTSLVEYLLPNSGVQSNALSNSFPVPGNNFPHTNLTPAQCAPVGFQALAPINPNSGYLVSDELTNALAAGAQWVQLYPGDPASDPTAESAMAAFNTAVGA